MEIIELERIIKSCKKVNVLNYPVGIDIYQQNPYRICNISPNGSWKDTGTKLRVGFNRFFAFSQINKIEKTPIGDDAEFLLSDTMKRGYNNIKANIEKANAKLIWKIFWFNHLENDYETLPRDMNLIDPSNMNHHSQAILYHFLAIKETLKILENPQYLINLNYWEKALSKWGATFRDEIFWKDIDGIIQSEKANGNFEFRNYHLDSLKEELPSAIFNTLISIPLRSIENKLNNKYTGPKNSENFISPFLKLILKSKLGNESLRIAHAKKLIENQISSNVISELESDNLQKLADCGEYRKLYEKAMHLIDLINTETQNLKEIVSKNSFPDTSTIQDIDAVQEIHERAVEPLLEAIKSFAVMELDNMEREIIDKTFFTQLILCMRILCELKISPSSRAILIKNVFDLSSRFAYKQISKEELFNLNLEKKALAQIKNDDLFEKFYLLQYCYFINGEFADPDASFYKTYKTTKGIVLTTTRTFIPRSKLAKDFHDSNINLSDVKKRMHNNNGKQELKEKQKRLDKKVQILKQQQQQIESTLSVFNKKIKNLNTNYKTEQDKIEEKIKNEVKVLKTRQEFINKIKPIEKEKERLEIEKKNSVKKYDLKRKKNRALQQTILGIILLLMALSYFISSLLVFHFYSIAGFGIIGITGLFLSGNADRIRNKIDKIKEAANKEINKIKISISIENNKIEVLLNALYPVAKSKFQKEIDEFKKELYTKTAVLEKNYNTEQLNKNLTRIHSEMDSIDKELQGITKILQNYTIVKELTEAGNHPLEKIIQN